MEVTYFQVIDERSGKGTLNNLIMFLQVCVEKPYVYYRFINIYTDGMQDRRTFKCGTSKNVRNEQKCAEQIDSTVMKRSGLIKNEKY